jgi:hypothetical protein
MRAILENNSDLELKAIKSYSNTILSKEDEEDIRYFHDFCIMFLSQWDEYLERISPFILEFNSKRSSISFKRLLADIIEEQYREYLNDLTNLDVPIFLDKSFNLFLNSIKYKKIFFSIYFADPNNKYLDNIKNESNLAEEQFWLDIYRKNAEIEWKLNDYNLMN